MSLGRRRGANWVFLEWPGHNDPHSSECTVHRINGLTLIIPGVRGCENFANLQDGYFSKVVTAEAENMKRKEKKREETTLLDAQDTVKVNVRQRECHSASCRVC